MAKRANTKKATRPTTRTTVTRSRKGGVTRTTTTRSSYKTVPRKISRAKRSSTRVVTKTVYVPKKTGHAGTIAAIVVIVLLLVALAYYLGNPVLTPAQQLGQFQNQLGRIQNNNQNLTNFYLASAPSFNLPVNKSWAVQITDEAAGNNTAIGQMTVSWNGQSESLSVQNGIVNTGISPTYAVTLTPAEFLQFSNTVITRNTAQALVDYSTYYLSGNLHYTKVS